MGDLGTARGLATGPGGRVCRPPPQAPVRGPPVPGQRGRAACPDRIACVMTLGVRYPRCPRSRLPLPGGPAVHWHQAGEETEKDGGRGGRGDSGAQVAREATDPRRADEEIAAAPPAASAQIAVILGCPKCRTKVKKINPVAGKVINCPKCPAASDPGQSSRKSTRCRPSFLPSSPSAGRRKGGFRGGTPPQASAAKTTEETAITAAMLVRAAAAGGQRAVFSILVGADVIDLNPDAGKGGGRVDWDRKGDRDPLDGRLGGGKEREDDRDLPPDPEPDAAEAARLTAAQKQLYALLRARKRTRRCNQSGQRKAGEQRTHRAQGTGVPRRADRLVPRRRKASPQFGMESLRSNSGTCVREKPHTPCPATGSAPRPWLPPRMAACSQPVGTTTRSACGM